MSDFEELEDLEDTGVMPRVFHKRYLLCPECNKPLTILEMSISSTGDICFCVVCCICGKDGTVVCSMHLLKKWALQLDGLNYIEGNKTVN